MINRLVEKWKPILDMMDGIDPIHYPMVAEYCEHMTIYEQHIEIPLYPTNHNRIHRNLFNNLPMGVKILAAINLNKVDFYYGESDISQSHKIAVSLTPDHIQSLRGYGIDALAQLENLIVRETINYINGIIDKDGGICINKLCYKNEEIEEFGIRKLVFYSKFLPSLKIRRRKIEKIFEEIERI